MKVFIYNKKTGAAIVTLNGDYFPEDAGDIEAVYLDANEPRMPLRAVPETGEIVFDESYTNDVKAQVLAERLAAIDAEDVAAGRYTDEELLAGAPLRPAWRPGSEVFAGMLLNHHGVLYKVLQGTKDDPVVTQAHEAPGMAGLLAVYAPIISPPPDGVVPEWLYGETGVETGDKRTWQGVVYEAVTSPGANIWEPDNAPALWRAASE
jgi:hypothetical protein